MKGAIKVKFKLLIDHKKVELVQAQVHQEDSFTDELKRFVLTNGNSNQLIAYDDKDLTTITLDEIIMITIIDNKTYALCLNNKQYHIKKRIYQLVDELPSSFWRINKSSIVNRHQIAHFVETHTAGVNVIMKNGLTDYVSRRCFARIRRELDLS